MKTSEKELLGGGRATAGWQRRAGVKLFFISFLCFLIDFCHPISNVPNLAFPNAHLAPWRSIMRPHTKKTMLETLANVTAWTQNLAYDQDTLNI